MATTASIFFVMPNLVFGVAIPLARRCKRVLAAGMVSSVSLPAFVGGGGGSDASFGNGGGADDASFGGGGGGDAMRSAGSSAGNRLTLPAIGDARPLSAGSRAATAGPGGYGGAVHGKVVIEPTFRGALEV